jgi:hypothetical protein
MADSKAGDKKGSGSTKSAYPPGAKPPVERRESGPSSKERLG